MKNLKSLIGKLNEPTRRALEAAAGFCLARTNYEVDIEHLLLKLLEMPNGDTQRIARYFEVDTSRLGRELTSVIERFKTGNTRTPAFSPRLPKLIADAWLIASVDFTAPRVRSGHLLLALLGNDELSLVIEKGSRELALVSASNLREKFSSIVAGSEEDHGDVSAFSEGPADATAPTTRTKALDQYTIDLTARARTGDIDPITGRDSEIRQLIDILMRRRQNNPILTGEAGVGKTAVVEGFAVRIAEGDVPPPLRHVAVRTLDLGLLQAGAGIKGEFEERLKSVINEVKASTLPTILFIDEAHTLIGAGGAAGQNDAANLLKPALARGELRTIAATTWSEYKKYFEKDAALARRFQVVKVDEPTPDQAVAMMRHLASKLEKHHRVRILDEAVEQAVRLSDRYLSGRQLPDKAVSVLDTACARLAINQSAVPAALEDARRRMAALDLEIGTLQREEVALASHAERIRELTTKRESMIQELSALEARWERERLLVQQIQTLRDRLESQAALPIEQPLAVGAGAIAASVGSHGGRADCSELRADLARFTRELAEVQEETPLIQPVVDARAVGAVISAWTGIPIGKMKGDELHTIRTLKDRLESRVLGQTHALATIADRIQISRVGLEDLRKPIGVFMLVGPSGVGKTETALALADTLYGGEQNLITVNMSEYQQAHTVSSLKGSPPGYVGYGEGGVLTEAVRRKPYSVVLLDEVEKADANVLELFYQVFDKGTLEDGEGREIDFKNTVILLTSNVGASTIMDACEGGKMPDVRALDQELHRELVDHFPPAFLGRLIVVPYYSIADSVMREIIRLQLRRIQSRLETNHRARLTYDEGLVDAIRSRCTEVDSGARNVEHILTRTLLPEISREVLARLAASQPLSSVHMTVDSAGALQYSIA
jgi:type VI secretion system protein VasG